MSAGKHNGRVNSEIGYGRVYFCTSIIAKTFSRIKKFSEQVSLQINWKLPLQKYETLPAALHVWLTLTSTHLRTLIRLSPYGLCTFPVRGTHCSNHNPVHFPLSNTNHTSESIFSVNALRRKIALQLNFNFLIHFFFFP